MAIGQKQVTIQGSDYMITHFPAMRGTRVLTHKKQTLFGAMGFLPQKPIFSRRTNLRNRSNLLVVRILKMQSDEGNEEF